MNIPKVIVDTREQKPYTFDEYNLTVENLALDVGDYSVEGYEDVFAVERKSLDDLTHSVGTDRERFEREIQRAQKLSEFAVIVESSRREVERNEYWSKIHPNAVLGTADKWPAKYNTLDFIWAGNRGKAKNETVSLLREWYAKYNYELF